MTSQPRAAGMIDARRRDSATKRHRVRATVDRMLAEGTPITFATVARHADVSTWLVYAPGVRELIETARDQQQANAQRPDHRETATPAGLATDLALARAEIQRLRAEQAQHQQQLRLALGARLDNLAKADLTARVDELTRANTELAATLSDYQSDNQALHARITELEDDLTLRAPACAA
jgi:hypothetical protein